jgi:protein-tyrosine phosphatase
LRLLKSICTVTYCLDWDDGPRTLQESLLIVQKAASLGVKQILVTPHVGRSFGNNAERASRDIAAATAWVQSAIDSAGIKVHLIAAAELTLSPLDTVARVKAEPWLLFGGDKRYVLVESPLHLWPDWADQVLFELSLQNITPIIAHPERLTDVQKDISPMQRAISCGALLQVTARSLVGPERKTQECCRRLLQAGLVSVVASDAHSAKYPMPGEVTEEVCALVGESMAEQILVGNPHAILTGAPLAALMPVVKPAKTHFGPRRLIARLMNRGK